MREVSGSYAIPRLPVRAAGPTSMSTTWTASLCGQLRPWTPTGSAAGEQPASRWSTSTNFAARKVAALLARQRARDMFDSRLVLSMHSLDLARLRSTFVIYGAVDRRDWRTVSVEDVAMDPAELARLLVYGSLGWYCLPYSTPLQSSQPQFEDGSVYRQNRPARRRSNSPWGLRSLGSQSSQPHLKDSSVYRTRWWAYFDDRQILGGVPRSILYDNTRLAVAKILGDGRRQRTRVFSELVMLLIEVKPWFELFGLRSAGRRKPREPHSV